MRFFPLRFVACTWLLGSTLASAQTAASDDQTAQQGESQVKEVAGVSPTATTTPPRPEPGDMLATNAATPGVTSGSGKPDRVANGERVSVRNGDFSIIPPKGWDVYEHMSNLTMLMQIPHSEGIKYQRTIQVASFTGPRYIDETTAKEYEEVITRKFAATSSAIENYRIRNHMIIEMKDGRQGLLFYTEFTLNGVALMQAHILVSSGSRHYLMTFTDVAEHFESDAANQFLAEAWDSMIEVQLGGPSPARFAAVTYGGAAAIGLFVLMVIFVVVRRIVAARQYKNYANGDSDDTLEHSEEATPISKARRPRSKQQHVATKHSEAAVELPRAPSAREAKTKLKDTKYDDDDLPISISRPTKKSAVKKQAVAVETSAHVVDDESMGLDIDDDEAV